MPSFDPYKIRDNFPVLLPEEAARWDTISIEKYQVSSKILMANAALSVFHHIRRKDWFLSTKEFHFLLGPGNNGGDGYALAYYMATSFYAMRTLPRIILWELKETPSNDGSYFKNLLLQIPNIEWKKLEHFCNEFQLEDKHTVIIDALFGTGFSREIQEPIASCLQHANKSKAYRIAMDIPSGVFGNGNFFSHEAFLAHETHTFGSYKIAHLLEPGILYAGRVYVHPIGFFYKETDPEFSFLSRGKILKKTSWKKSRDLSAHKYRSGKLILLGGSTGMEGAAILAAKSFLKAGGGIVRLFSESPTTKQVLKDFPEIMIRSGNPDDLCELALSELEQSAQSTSLLIGPGLGFFPNETFWNKLSKTLGKKALILDGSVLNESLSTMATYFSSDMRIYMTPHAAEASRLLRQKIMNIREAALSICKNFKADVYIKGPGGIVVQKESLPKEIYVNSKLSRLAVAGTGDVFAGLLAFSAIHEVDVWQATFSRYFAAAKKAGENLTPSDLINHI